MRTAEKNLITVVGKAITIPHVDHKTKTETFYSFTLQVPRKSGTFDKLPVIISENFISKVEMDKDIMIKGQIRTYDNNKDKTKSRLLIYVFVNDIKVLDDNSSLETTNLVEMTGFICKEPIHRQTPLGRNITDVLIAVNDKYKHSYYVPCVVWGRQANFVKDLPIGTHLELKARFQSREYNKQLDNGESEVKNAYELSVNAVSLVKDEKEEE